MEVYFEKENIYTLDSKGELLITIMSSLAQEERRSISENVTWGQHKRMADGKVSLPYSRFLGYHKGEDGLPEIVPEEAEIIRLIYRSCMEGMTTNKIAQMLMEQGIPAPGGQKKWYSRTIESILTNEKYKGSALLQKKFTVDFLTKKTKVNEGEVPQYFVEHSHPPIVDSEEFDMVQAEIARRLSRKELLDGMLVYIQDQYTPSARQNPNSVRGMVRELETADLALTQFDEKLWRIMVENATVGLDGEMVFRFRNGMEVTV